MPNNSKNDDGPMVQVQIERLFDVINTLIDAGLADAVIKKFKGEFIVMSLAQATAFKSFVAEQITNNDLVDTEAVVDFPGSFNVQSVKKVRAVMPLDFDHCTVQYKA